MNISNIFVAALLATAVGASAAAPATPATPATPVAPAGPPAIKLSGITGVVQIKTPGGIMTVKAGEPIPDVPAGAEIIVVSGDASVAVGGVTIKAGAGDSFTVNTSGAGAVSVAVTGGLVAVVDAKGVSKDVAKGEGVTVTAAPAATPATPAAPVVKTETKETAPESIPADSGTTEPSTSEPPPSSPTQENTNSTPCINTSVSPSTPC